MHVSTRNIALLTPKAASGASLSALALDFTDMDASGLSAAGVTFSRASTATRVNSSGLIETVSSGAPRFDHDPTDNSPLGLLIEEARTNLVTQSANFTTAWSNDGTTDAGNTAIGPDGTTSADTISENTANARHIIYFPFTAPASSFTISVFLKQGTGQYAQLHLNQNANLRASVVVDLASGEITDTDSSNLSATSSVDDFGNGWFRVSLTATTTATTWYFIIAHSNSATPSYNAGGDVVYTGTSNAFYAWGAQAEAGSFPTSYIPTAGSTATRAADSASMTGTDFSDWYNQSEGTFAIEVSGAQLASTSAVISASNNTTAERIDCRHHAANHLFIVDGAGTQANIDAGTFTAGVFTKIALAYKINDFAACINGGAVATDTSGTVPTPDRLYIGVQYNGATGWLNGHIKSLTYYDTRKSDTELQELTA